MVLAALGWLAIVAVGSTLVWTVVAHAGRGVGQPVENTSTESAAAGPSGVGEATATAVSAPSAGQSPSPSASTGPTATGGGTGPATGSGPGEGGSANGPGEASSSGPGDGVTGSPPSTDPPATQDPDDEASSASGPPATETHQKTWQGAAGRIVASCTGPRISLVSAVPNNGWHVEVGDDGPEELSVHFELLEEEDDDRVAARAVPEEEVHARCVSGTPSFTAEG